MGAFGGLVLTNKGRALQAKVQAGAALVFNRIGVGDGNLGSQQISDLNALISEKKSLAISKLKTQAGGKAIVGSVLSNQDVMVGFYFREIGVFAQDPTDGEILYCYANSGAGAEYIPAGGGADVVEKNIDILTLTANAANVTATVESGIYAAAADVGDMSTVPTTAKDAAGAITELHASISDIGTPTSAATPDTTVKRDANSRFKAAAPAAADDVDTKGARDAAIAALVASSPAALDTLNELAAALGNDPNFATTITNSLAAKAPLSSPAFTGIPTAPTAASGTNTTQIASTAFVQTALESMRIRNYMGV